MAKKIYHHVSMYTVVDRILGSDLESLLPQNLPHVLFSIVHGALNDIVLGNRNFDDASAAAIMLIGRLMRRHLGRNPTYMELAKGMDLYYKALNAVAMERDGDATYFPAFTLRNVVDPDRDLQIVPTMPPPESSG